MSNFFKQTLPCLAIALQSCSKLQGSLSHSQSNVRFNKNAIVATNQAPQKTPVTVTEKLGSIASTDDEWHKTQQFNLASEDINCPRMVFPKARVWRITPEQIKNILKDGFGLDAKESDVLVFNDSLGSIFSNEEAGLSHRADDFLKWSVASGFSRSFIETTFKETNRILLVKRCSMCRKIDLHCFQKIAPLASNWFL